MPWEYFSAADYIIKQKIYKMGTNFLLRTGENYVRIKEKRSFADE